jgi:uncharacterized surface protein with fasciclin (FAS1) repeats
MKIFQSLIWIVLFTAISHAVAKEAGTEPVAQGDILSMLKTDGHYRTLLSMLDETNLSEDLRTQTAITVFAPTDEALQKFGNLGSLRQDREGLKAVLNNHFAAGKLTSDDLKRLSSLTMRGGKTWTIETEGKMINDAKIVQPNMIATNGVVHGIDLILLKNAGSN